MQIPDFRVNINVSQVQITKSDVITDLISETNTSGLPLTAIAIELTESILLEKNEKAQNFLKELKQAYCQGFYWGRSCPYDEFRKHFVDVDR